jgi:glycosyltransferase involved in cell wall biosynthesis
MAELSVVITARNEEFLKITVEDVLAKRRGDTEVIVILDGAWAEPKLIQHPDLTVIYHKESVGQRAAINEAVKISKAKYIMKLDAHCILDEGFDLKLIQDSLPNQVSVPAQYNLHAFDWQCKKCGNRWYQSPTPKHCQNSGEGRGENPNCDSTEFERVMVWERRKNRITTSWCFDKDLHFQYDEGIAKRQTGQVIETMSLIGACFFMEREWYWKIGGSDEKFGSWGQQGTEISCKTWFRGGRVVTNKNTWFAHMFRTQGGDFGFPYPQSGNQVEHARKYSKELFLEGKYAIT